MVKAGTGLKSGGAEEAPPGGGERAGLSASRAAANPIPAPREEQESGSQSREPGLSPPLAALAVRLAGVETLRGAGLEDAGAG